MQTYVINQNNNFYYTAYGDLAACVIFLISIYVFKIIENNAIEENRK